MKPFSRIFWSAGCRLITFTTDCIVLKRRKTIEGLIGLFVFIGAGTDQDSGDLPAQLQVVFTRVSDPGGFYPEPDPDPTPEKNPDRPLKKNGFGSEFLFIKIKVLLQSSI